MAIQTADDDGKRWKVIYGDKISSFLREQIGLHFGNENHVSIDAKVL